MRVLDKPSTRTNIEIPFLTNDYSSAQPTAAFTPVYVPPTRNDGTHSGTRRNQRNALLSKNSMLDRIVYRPDNCNIIIISFRIWWDLEEEIKLRCIFRLSRIRYFSIWLSFFTFEGIFFLNNSKSLLYILYVINIFYKRLVNQTYSLLAKLDDLEPERISCISNSINLNF